MLVLPHWTALIKSSLIRPKAACETSLQEINGCLGGGGRGHLGKRGGGFIEVFIGKLEVTICDLQLEVTNCDFKIISLLFIRGSANQHETLSVF